MPYDKNSDLALWLRLKKGDKEAFSLLFQQYHSTLYNYGIKVSPNRPDLVEDAIQDLFIDLWRLRGGLTDKVESIKFYLYRSLRRKLHLSAQANKPLVFTDTEIGKILFDDSPETQLVQTEWSGEQGVRLKRLVEQLPKRQKEALTLKYFEGFSNQDIAGIMGVNEKSVRNFLYKAILTLKTYEQWLTISWILVIAT